MSDKVAVIARIAVAPEAADEAARTLTGLVDDAAAEAGTEVYACHREGASTFWFYELYTDHAALDVHGKSPALAEAFGALGATLDGPPQISVLLPLRAKGLDL